MEGRKEKVNEHTGHAIVYLNGFDSQLQSRSHEVELENMMDGTRKELRGSRVLEGAAHWHISQGRWRSKTPEAIVRHYD